MKLFFYYTLHSFWNQVRKLFKSWMLIFILACALVGGLVGVGAAMINDVAESTEEEITEEAEEKEEHTLESVLGIEREAAIELIAGLAVLALFTFSALLSDKNGSKIFLPADVPLLFASPMAPQSVLLFRLGTQLGSALFFGVYLLIQVPNMVINFGFSLSAALSIIVSLALTVATGKLLQVMLYMLCARSPRMKEHLRYYIYAFLVFLFALFFLRFKKQGSGWAAAAAGIFNARYSKLIPFWGWLKGFAGFAIAGKWGYALCELAAIFAGIAFLVYLIYHIKADFYEDAMAKSEETAETLRRAQGEETAVAMRKRKKDRSDKIRRDGMNKGSGANVFFYKCIYNRFRFAHFGFLTKTMEVYLLAAVGVTVFCIKVLEKEPFYPVVLTLAAFSFYRSLGDSLATDVKLDFFLLIPESSERKVFFSLLGNAVNCLLDLLPAMLVPVLAGASPFRALCWMLLIVSVDFYGSTVMAFLDVSTPANAGKTVKSLIQVLFVYFGLIPDALFLSLALVLDRMTAGAAASVVVNMLLGVVFLSLLPRYVDPPMDRPAGEKKLFSGDERSAKKTFSRVGFGIFVFLAGGSAFQLLISLLVSRIAPAWLESQPLSWLLTFAPLYLIAFPLCLLIMGKPSEPRLRKCSLGFSAFLTAIICSFSLMYLGNMIGLAVTNSLAKLLHSTATNPVLTLVSSESMALKVLFIVFVAPIIEEYTFRRRIIDLLHVYGEKRAVFISALLFGLFHGNLSQFFYAFLLGLVFGTVYVKSGKLRYSLALHMLINFMGSILAPALLENLDLEAMSTITAENLASVLTTPMVLYFAYVGFMVLTALLGLILMLIRRKELRFDEEPWELRGAFARSVTWGNAGMLLMLLSSLSLMVYFVL